MRISEEVEPSMNVFSVNKAYFVFLKNTDMDITLTEKSQIYNKGNIQLYYYEIDLINFTSRI